MAIFFYFLFSIFSFPKKWISYLKNCSFVSLAHSRVVRATAHPSAHVHCYYIRVDSSSNKKVGMTHRRHPTDRPSCLLLILVSIGLIEAVFDKNKDFWSILNSWYNTDSPKFGVVSPSYAPGTNKKKLKIKIKSPLPHGSSTKFLTGNEQFFLWGLTT